MYAICISIVAVGITCSAFTSFAQQSNRSIVVTSKSPVLPLPSKGVFPKSNLVIVEGEATIVGNELTKQINELISNKAFTELNKLADDLRKSKAQTANGTWRLLKFYEILSYDWDGTEDMAEDLWKARLNFLNSWVESIPTSITAQVALARYYKNYAWKARGTGFANTVTDQGWRLFKERLQQARQTLTEARKLESKCPVWWDTMQIVARGEGWNLDSYEKVFNEAVAFEPAYTDFYNNKVTYLLPRWFGKEGDWQKFAAQSADKRGGEAGDILYARIGWRVHQRGVYDGFLKDAGYSWPRMKKGLEVIVKQNPNSLTAASELAYLAYQAKDRACAKPLFERIDTKVDNEIWGDDKARFFRAWIWAFSE